MFNFFEFFAGGGMVSAALSDGWRCTFANDFDSKKCASYKSNFGSDALTDCDVGAVSVRDLPGKPDMVWSSFPCQDLSLAGARSGLIGSKSSCFWPFWRLITELSADNRKPNIIALENVCGLLTANNGEDFQTIVRALAVENYFITALVINADIFLPQSRPRLFILAFQSSVLNNIPISRDPNSNWHPQRLIENVKSMPIFLKDHWFWSSPPTPPLKNISLSDIIEDDKYVTWDSSGKTDALLNMMSPINANKISSFNQEHRAVGALFKRTRIEKGKRIQRAEVRFDGIAGCLRTPGGGSSKQTLIVIDKGKVKTRLFTGRETARLMGLPDNYKLPQKLNDTLRLTGDGVAVPVVRFLNENIFLPALKGMETVRHE